ncbi:hypothetical protein DVH24_017417 [Malus domestica]|uniref:Uncharacterized protein n=1 Tax=Malus domestica TaxID=3750 RepID=A0A498IW58_MALDO|nr:hypothetical protein DVH24_017417 [Malus domestica]
MEGGRGGGEGNAEVNNNNGSQEKADKKKQKVAFYKLFSFADRLDVALMIVGTISAVGNGLSKPLMTLVFGNLINTFGCTDPGHIVPMISKVSLKFVYLAIGTGAAALLQVACWMVTGERQAARIRGKYMKAILRQDIGFFDTETSTGEIIGRMSGDTILIQEAMGEMVGKFIQLCSTFLGGFVIAFVKGWRLTVVLLATIPAIVIAGAVMATIMSRMSSRGQSAYAEAGSIVEQTVGSIRTVASFTGEKQAIEQYNQKLKVAYNTMVQQGLVTGIGLGIFMLVIFCSYALAVWYGSKMIIKHGYNGGQVINVIFALMTGGMSLGQASPSLNAFASGKAAAYKIIGTHDELTRDPEGAYSQLIHLQEGSKVDNGAQTSDPNRMDTSLDIDRTMLSSGSRRLSMRRSISRGSSGGRHSFTVGFGIPGPIDVQENEVGHEDDHDRPKVDSKKRNTVSIRRLAALNKPEVPVLLLGAIAAAGHGVLFPIFGLLLSKAIGMFYEPPNELRHDSRKWALVYVGLGCAGLLVVPVQNFFFGVAGGKLVERIRALSFQKVVHQQVSWFDDPANSSGAIGARLSTDASTIKSLVGDALALIVQNIATIMAGLVIGFTANWKLMLVVLAVSPLILLQGTLQAKFLKGFSADAKIMYEEASQVANDAIGSIRTVASFCSEKKVMEAYEKKCEGPLKQGVRLGVVSGSGFGFSFFLMFCTNALIFYIGAILVKHGQATFEQVFKVFFAITITAMGVSQATSMAPDSNKAKDSAASIFRILDSKPKIDSSSDEGIALSLLIGEIELDHVSFKYPTRPDVQIFRDICLKMPSGKTVALVGESGSGKSTVIGLIERFYDPDSGRVLLDGVEIQKFKLNWLRQQIGLVGQEPVLFNESIRANIAYGKPGDVTEEEIIAATTAANVHNVISSLPQGYDASVGERGVQLSGGQKQRIAIARAILKDPKILLLDEATSALDAESERKVQDALDRVMVNRTTVVVAHRLSTIKGADIIAVVKNGVIAEKGSHDFLMKITDGAYASLVALHSSSNT